MKRSFEDIIDNLKDSIADYSFYTNFKKVFENVEKIEIELNILNYLIGKKDDFDEKFLQLIEEHPKVLSVIPILLAVRRTNILLFKDELIDIKFDSKNKDDFVYLEFMEKTGLKKLFTEEKIKNLVDYVLGVEVGLDSNARKNRTGTSMENIIHEKLKEIPNIKILKEATAYDIKREFKTDKMELMIKKSNVIKPNKRFDFVVMNSKGKIFLIETNFYSNSGSKLNETARSYIKLDDEISKLNDVEFIWITDGKGWKSAKNNLNEAYQSIINLITLYEIDLAISKIVS